MAIGIIIQQKLILKHRAMLHNKNKVIKNNKKTCSSDSLHTRYDETLSVSKLRKARFFLPYRIYTQAVHKKIFTQKLRVNIVQKQKQYERKLWYKGVFHDSEDKIVAVTDIDEDYFQYVDGRPLRVFSPAFKSEKTFLNQRLKMKYDEAVKKDCILNIETEYLNEIKCYNISLTRLMDQVKYFDTFVLEDYKKSMKLMEQCEDINVKVKNKTKELQRYALDLFNIKSKLIILDYKYNIQQKYGRFLYYLSPQTWRMNNRDFAHSMEIEAKGFDLGRLGEDDTFDDVYEKLKSVCSETPTKPVMYFKNSSDLIEVFNAMEKQQLYYFAHVTHVKPRSKLLKDNIKVLKNTISQDYDLIDQLISSFKDLIEFTEKSCTELEKKFFNILHGLFYQTTGTMNVLRMRVNLDFVHEKVFLDQPTNIMDIFTVTKELENCYLEYSKRLDAIHSHSVRNAMVKYVESEKRKLKNAEIAHTELRLFHRLECRLLRAHGFLPKDTNAYVAQPGSIAIKRSESRCVKKKKLPLSEAELEYLTLFTDWCPSDSHEETQIYLCGV